MKCYYKKTSIKKSFLSIVLFKYVFLNVDIFYEVNVLLTLHSLLQFYGCLLFE